ncbi:hypothetical protein M9458_051905 [Cirrhinus mrigala]|uniref:Uncharacterized protein n=1 Tax=Cirrhinus mrigala TaxID=683832 RepID=A0ABD0MSR3_CIRMR
MSKATEEFGVPSLPCMAHTLQLAVHDSALSQRSVADVAALGKRMVGHFKHSQLPCSCLQSIQKDLGMPIKRLQQDIATRWNSTFYMLESLVEQKRALAAYAAEFELPKYKDRYFDEDKKMCACDLLLKVVDEMMGSEDQRNVRKEGPPEKKTRAGSLLDMYEEILEENVLLEERVSTETSSQVKRRAFTNAFASKNAVVCSVQFTPEDYHPGDMMEFNMGCRSRLRAGAIPSVHTAPSSGPPSACGSSGSVNCAPLWETLQDMRVCEDLKQWTPAVINHLYWTAASAPNGDADVMEANGILQVTKRSTRTQHCLVFHYTCSPFQIPPEDQQDETVGVYLAQHSQFNMLTTH